MITHFRQRPPVFISAVFAFGIVVCYCAGTWHVDTAGKLLIIAFFAGTVTSAVFLYRHPVYLILTLIMLFCLPLSYAVMGYCRANEQYAQRYAGRYANVEGRVYRQEYNTNSHIAYVRADKVSGVKVKPFNILVVTPIDESVPKLYERAVYNVEISRHDKGLYGISDEQIYRSRSVFVAGNGKFVYVTEKAEGFYSVLRTVKEVMEKAVNRLFYSELCKALITGNKNDLSSTDYNTFSKAGVSHVLALSGLHISVILAVFYFVARTFSVPHKIYVTGAVLLVVFYMALTGFSYSVFRAGLMTVFTVSAGLAYKRYDGLNGLFTALFVILLCDPYSAGDASFRLSFLATLGIIVVALPLIRRTENMIYKLKRKTFVRHIPGIVICIIKLVIISVIITMSVTLFTFPALLIHFGNIRTTALFANIFIVPLISCVIISVLLYILVSLVPVLDVLCALLRNIIDIQTGLMYDIAEFWAGISMPVYRLSGAFRDITAVLMLILLFTLVIVGARLRYYLIAPLFLLCVCAGAAILNYAVRETQVHCLNYMHSQNVIFRNGDCITVYKANGDDSTAVTEFCDEYGINTIDTIIIPVTGDDYRRYFDSIFAHDIKIRRVLHCPLYANESFCRRIREYFISRGVEFDTFEYSEGTNAGELDFEVDMKSYSVYRFKCNFAGKSVFYGVNLYGHGHSPVSPKADIALLYGEREVISSHYTGDTEYLLTDASKYGDMLKGINTYDLSSAAGYIFRIKNDKISMRSIG